jgi:glutathione S-transferase
MRLYVTPASPWVRRVRVCILELGIEDKFEFVQTRWPHSWGTQTVAMPADFTAATPVMRIPALVADDVTLTDSHAICDYLNGKFGELPLLAREGARAGRRSRPSPSPAACSRRRSCGGRAAALRQGTLERLHRQDARPRVPLLRRAGEALPTFGGTFDLAQITTAVACGYDDWRYGPDWRGAAPKLAAWYDSVAERPSLEGDRARRDAAALAIEDQAGRRAVHEQAADCRR